MVLKVGVAVGGVNPEETAVVAVDVANRRADALIFGKSRVRREHLVELVTDESEAVVVAACAEDEFVVANDLRRRTVGGGQV